MVSYVQGTPVPTIGEVGWGDEMNAWLTVKGGEYINPKDAPYGALGNGVHDDTAAFVLAIAAMVSSGIHSMYIPAGTYILDGALIEAAITPAPFGWKFVGAGMRATILKAKASATYAFGVSGGQRLGFYDLSFYGRGSGSTEGGFCSRSNAQGFTFVHCSFEQAAIGCALIALSPGSPTNQNDKHTWVGCIAADSAIGLHVNANNGQCQLWLGGSFDGCTTGMKISAGWYMQIGGMVQSCTTSYDVETARSLQLENVITEADTVSVNVQTVTTPGVIYLRNTTLQGSAYTIKCDAGASPYVDSAYCTFDNGDLQGGTGSMMWHSRGDNIGGLGGSTGTFTPGTLTKREYEIPGFRISQTGSTIIRVEAASGYTDVHTMASPATPSANYLRFYALNSSGKLTVKDSAGVETPLY